MNGSCPLRRPATHTVRYRWVAGRRSGQEQTPRKWEKLYCDGMPSTKASMCSTSTGFIVNGAAFGGSSVSF